MGIIDDRVPTQYLCIESINTEISVYYCTIYNQASSSVSQSPDPFYRSYWCLSPTKPKGLSLFHRLNLSSSSNTKKVEVDFSTKVDIAINHLNTRYG